MTLKSAINHPCPLPCIAVLHIRLHLVDCSDPVHGYRRLVQAIVR
jgi:hypothetical protein